MAPLWSHRSGLAAVLVGALLPQASLGRSLRRHRARASHEADPAAESEKVQRLLLDVDESVRKSASDAEFVYATLFSYEQQLQASLDQEVAKVSKEVSELKNGTWGKAQGNSNDTAVAAAKSPDGANLTDKYSGASAKLTEEGASIEGRLQAVNLVACYLRQGNMAGCAPSRSEHETPSNALSSAIKTTQVLLQEHQELRGKFSDVFGAFLPTAHGNKRRMKVHLTKTLKARSVEAVSLIEVALKKQQATVLLQKAKVESLQRSFSEAAAASGDAKIGIEAEEQQNVQEKAFTTEFAEAILRIDKAFVEKVGSSIRKKADLVATLRQSRDNQHRTLHELVDLLRGRYSVGANSTRMPDAAALAQVTAAAASARGLDLPVSFLQARSSSQGGASSGLDAKFEDALRKKEDTHALLMEVKSMLDKSEPVDAQDAHSIVGDLQGVVSELNEEHSRAADVKQRCEAESVSASSEGESLRSNFLLMSAVRNRTRSAIDAAKNTLKNIADKTQALDGSRANFVKMVDKMLGTLQDQSRDRRTIEAAVQKAQEIVNKRTPADTAPAADALIFQMLKELRREDETEKAYRSTEMAFRDAFLSYSGSYVQLLHERRGHYASSLSSLELYASEVDSDLASQESAVNSGNELQKERKEVCAALVAMCEKHRTRHAELAKSLRSVLPDLPAFLSMQAE